MPRRRRRRRFHFLIGACAGACIALDAIVGAWALGLGPFAPVIVVPDAFADRITVEGDGGFTYLFPEEDIAYDADEHALYADDTLIAYLEPGVGALDNGEGLRGVAAGDDDASPTLVCADYTSAEYASKGGDAAVLRALVQEGMPGQGGIAVNCSYGVPPTSTFDAWGQDGRREALIRHARDTSEAYLAAIVCLMLDARQAGPDGTGRDFLFVQSAGNGLVDGAPLGAYANGYFAGIDEDLFEECFPEGEVAGISFGDVHAHTLVVGAARERTEGEVALQGDEWRLCETSCFGEPWVDLCAPGPHKGVYAACVDGYGPFGDTSAAAPMATGSAALLWSLDPSLTAAEVRSLLVHSGDGAPTILVDHCGNFNDTWFGTVGLSYDEAGLLGAYR